MKVLQKNVDIIITIIFVILGGIIPVIRFSINMMDFIHTWGEQEVRLGLVDLWHYMLWVVDGAWFIYVLPVIIPILTTYWYHQDYHSNESTPHKTIKKSYVRSILLVLGYSAVLLILAIILPTASTNEYFDQPFVWIFFFHLNITLQVVFITTLGLITMTVIKRYYLAFMGYLGLFVVITMFLISLGAMLEGVFPEPFNSDWFYIYNTIAFDSGMPELFGTVMLLILTGISVVVFRQLLHNNE